MLGIVVELLLSWLLLRFFVKERFSVLGIKPTGNRMIELVTGVLWPVLFTCLLQYVISLLTHNPYHLNPYYTWPRFWASSLYLAKSVVYENLVFNGALLYLLIKYAGGRWAIWLSAMAFGIYHWFSWNAFGNPVQMAIIFLMTAGGGYVFALAYEKTRSVYLSFALHFGCDFAPMILFSLDKGMGKQLLVKTFEHDPTSPGSVISIAVIVVSYTWFPVLTWLLLRKINGRQPGAKPR